MTVDDPTPEEWTGWQLNQLRICRDTRSSLETMVYELEQSSYRIECIKTLTRTPTSHHLAMAMQEIKEAIGSLRQGIQYNEQVAEALERIICRQDMSERALQRELAIIRRRDKDEPQ